MALTRKMLSAMEIPAEKVDEIISAYMETVNEIKEERDKLKGEVESLRSVEKELEKAQESLKAVESDKSKSDDWHKKYDELKAEYDNFKSDVNAKATKASKEAAYKKLLVEAGVSAKRIDSIMKVSDANVDSIEFDDDGNIKDAETLIESVKTEWADFIPVTQEKGADVANPPANNGGDIKKPSRAAEMVAQYRTEHYGNPTKED